MKLSHILAHMRAAYAYSHASHAVRRHVGAVLIKHNAPIACGWNGTPPNHQNCCEDDQGKTLGSVIHAEVNVYLKLMKINESSTDTSLFVTCAPCPNCAEFIINNTNTKTIYFSELYRDIEGLRRLLTAGIELYRVVDDQIQMITFGEIDQLQDELMAR